MKYSILATTTNSVENAEIIHSIEDIKKYTLNQVVSFYEAIHEERMDNVKRDVVVQATAMSGDSKQIRKFIDDLDGKPPEMMKIVREE